MGSPNLLSQVKGLIYGLSRIMAVVAALCLAVMMVLTVADVGGRYFFKTPVSGAWELISLLLVCAGTWGLAYCQMENAHISVTVLLYKFSRRTQAIILSVAYLSGLTAFSAMSWRAVVLALKYYHEKGHATDILHIPYSPFLLVLALGTGVLALVLLLDLLQTLGKAVRS